MLEHVEIFPDWANRSLQYRSDSRNALDVSYGPSEAESLVLFLPSKDSAPVLTFIRGGYRRFMDKDDLSAGETPALH